MLSNKSLLYGLGIGLIIGAILLQLMTIANSASATLPSSAKTAEVSELDRAALKEAAGKYFQVYENDQQIFSQAQVDTIVKQKVKEETDKLAVNQQLPSASKETYVYISSGLNAGNVGELLFRGGVITDRKAFEDMMTQQQLNEKIVVGVHSFKIPSELNAVVSKITSR